MATRLTIDLGADGEPAFPAGTGAKADAALSAGRSLANALRGTGIPLSAGSVIYLEGDEATGLLASSQGTTTRGVTRFRCLVLTEADVASCAGNPFPPADEHWGWLTGRGPRGKAGSADVEEAAHALAHRVPTLLAAPKQPLTVLQHAYARIADPGILGFCTAWPEDEASLPGCFRLCYLEARGKRTAPPLESLDEEIIAAHARRAALEVHLRLSLEEAGDRKHAVEEKASRRAARALELLEEADAGSNVIQEARARLEDLRSEPHPNRRQKRARASRPFVLTLLLLAAVLAGGLVGFTAAAMLIPCEQSQAVVRPRSRATPARVAPVQRVRAASGKSH